MRIGIDVGGTHTDAVILEGDRILATTKALTSADVVTGISHALDTLLADGGLKASEIKTVMIGTTQFTNAIVQRRDLSPTGVIRIGLPSGKGMPPMIDWPDDMSAAVNASVYMIQRLGLMERENAAIMNATLLPFAGKVVDAFLAALKNRKLNCPAYISQNDGTLMSSEFVRNFPALTFSSGPTNSLRGAYKLTGLEDAIVVDIGGTTSDIGVLQNGFPRESNVVVNIGGVRTNFRMPDILALGLGGGSLVSKDGKNVGPQSVGHKLVTEGLVFGGDKLTTTDIIVAAGKADIGDKTKVAHLPESLVSSARETMRTKLDNSIAMSNIWMTWRWVPSFWRPAAAEILMCLN